MNVKYCLYEDIEGLPTTSTLYDSLDELKKGFTNSKIKNAKTFKEVKNTIETLYPFLSVYKEDLE